MSRSLLRFWVAMVLLALCSSAVGWAQLYTGSMTGVVVDPSGGVIPNANVTLTDVSRGFTYKAVTDTAGRYVVRSLPPSTYNVKVEAAGFRSAVQENVNISVNQNATVDIPLTVQGTEQSIQVVETGTPALQTEDAVTGQNINRTFINDLPLVGRAVFDLAKLAPGVSEPRGNSGWDTDFISQGSRNATADVLLDGVSTVSAEQNGTFQLPLYTPSVDAVQEFKIQQSNFSAEVGFTGSTVMNVVTRSGTNSFHGSAYEFFRNEKLNANNFFANAAGRDAQGNAIAPMPKMRWNQFGGTIGGPIKKDRIFFFADYQGTRERAGQTFRGGVPSAAMKAGDFSEICSGGFNAAGLCGDGEGQLWDPYVAHWDNGAGGPIKDQFIPFNNIANYISPGAPQAGMPLPQTKGNLIDPVAAKMMAYFPSPEFRRRNRSLQSVQQLDRHRVERQHRRPDRRQDRFPHHRFRHAERQGCLGTR